DTANLAVYGMLIEKYALSFDKSQESEAIRLNALPVFENVLVQQPGRSDVRKALVTLILHVASKPEQYLIAAPHINRLIATEVEIRENPSATDLEAMLDAHIDRLLEDNTNKAQSSREELARLLNQRGRIYQGEQNYESAVLAYERAIKVNPKQ